MLSSCQGWTRKGPVTVMGHTHWVRRQPRTIQTEGRLPFTPFTPFPEKTGRTLPARPWPPSQNGLDLTPIPSTEYQERTIKGSGSSHLIGQEEREGREGRERPPQGSRRLLQRFGLGVSTPALHHQPPDHMSLRYPWYPWTFPRLPSDPTGSRPSSTRTLRQAPPP